MSNDLNYNNDEPKKQLQAAYKVAHCQTILGRYLVASRDICKGEIIFQEQPLAVAPQKNSALICPGCFSDPTTECPKCGWPLCSKYCPGLQDHQTECDAIIRNRDEVANGKLKEDDWIQFQDALMTLRCLSLKNKNPEKWIELLGMETNWLQWSKSPLYVNALEFVHRIRKQYSIAEEKHGTDEILKILAILDINAYEVKMPNVNIQGCYKLASLAEHSCVPNAFKTTSSNTFLLTMRALTDISKGSHLSTTYCDILWPTMQRQRYIQFSKFFMCQCNRCMDSTELGSYISSFVCPNCNCPRSPITPILTINRDIIKEDEEEEQTWTNTYKDYECKKCKAIFPASRCESFMISAEKELQDLQDKESSVVEDKNAANFEAWLENWTVPPAAKNTLSLSNYNDENVSSSSITRRQEEDDTCPILNVERRRKIKYSQTPLLFLHPQHFLSLDAAHSLFLLYSADSSTLDELLRKEVLGIHLLEATSTLFSGISMFRGTLFYELAMTKAALFAKYLEPEQVNKNDLKTIAQEILCLLTESLNEHLQYENEDQPEGQLCKVGRRQLEEFQAFFLQLYPISDD